MNEKAIKKFLLRLSDGSQYRILSRNGGICILKAANNGSWSEIALINEMHPCFYADVDSRDCIHIISQDLYGCIVHSKMENRKIISYKILKSSVAAPFDRSFFMLQKNTSPVFFYTIRKQSETVLVSQSVSGKAAAAPIPLVKVPDTINPYWISQYGQNSGLILFPKVSGMYTQICAGKFSLDMPSIASERLITKEEANCESPKCIVLPDGRIHMLYSVRKNGRYYLKYQKGDALSLDFSAAETIAFSRQTFSKYNLEYSNDALNINWLENGYIYFKEKKTGSEDFSEIQTFKSYRLRSMEYYYCRHSSRNKPAIYSYTELPLSFEGKLQYAFFREETTSSTKVINKKIEPKPANTPHPSSNSAIFRALTDYLSSREDFSASRQNDIQRIGDIAFQLSRLFAGISQISTKQEKKKEPVRNTFALRKIQGSHKYTLKK